MISGLLSVVLPVFLIIGVGYVSVWRGYFTDEWVDGLVRFTQNFAIPCLLFSAISTLDLSAKFDLSMMASYYSGAILGFVLGMLGARHIFKRDWPDCVAIGFCLLFSNAVLLGIPVTEQAYGTEALSENFALVSINAPICYGIGITVMEIVKNKGGNLTSTVKRVLNAMFHNALVIGIMLGFAVNLSGITLPEMITDAVDLMARAALPAALFSLGGVLVRYKPEGDTMTIACMIGFGLLIHPAMTWGLGRSMSISPEAFRAVVLTAAMPPGVNAYVFANMYGVARRVAASTVLISTALSVLTIWFWLSVIP